MIKALLKRLMRALPVSKAILFESCPDLSDNTKAVFDEFIARGLNRKYRLYWVCYDKYPAELPDLHNVKYISANRRWKFLFLEYTARAVICCNRFIGADKKDQTVYYLMHGSPIKNTSGFYVCPEYVDYMITAGAYMNSKSAAALKIDEAKCFPLGYPRNDILVKARVDVSSYWGRYKKYIIWYPTVKQMASGRDYGIKPISFLDHDKTAKALNNCAKENDVLIIVKPHFAQIANINTSDLSNIKFINDRFFKDNHLVPYEFMGSCDALLSDYSSVFYDFMLCGKPIGLIWNDVEEFKKNLGFYDFYEETTAGCEKLYSFESLCDFIKAVAEGRDRLAEERGRICREVNAPGDGKNAARVVDFIVERSKL